MRAQPRPLEIGGIQSDPGVPMSGVLVPAGTDDVEHWWSMFCHRNEHAFRFLKEHVGSTQARIRNREAADRRTALIVIAYTKLRLARKLAKDCRLPRQKPLPSEKLTLLVFVQAFAASTRH